MSNYKKIVESALKKATKEKLINESILYPEGLTERMHPILEDDLINDKHSLGKHPIFPEGDEYNFLQKIMGKRFLEVAKRCKRAFGVDKLDNNMVISSGFPLLKETMLLEKNHRQALEELAKKMVIEEFNIPEDMVELNAKLIDKVVLEGTQKNSSPIQVETEFDNHDEMVNANKEVYKRRFINAMMQGAAKKCNHMFHMVDDELTDLDPRLPSKYAKLMASADYMYYAIPKMDNQLSGGVVSIEYPSEQNPKAVISAQALVFPVLIHE